MCVYVCAHARVSLSWQLSLIDSCRPSGLHCNPRAPGVIGGQGSVAPPRTSEERGGEEGGDPASSAVSYGGTTCDRSRLYMQQSVGRGGQRAQQRRVRGGKGNHKGTTG